jgi:hypothetical protein
LFDQKSGSHLRLDRATDVGDDDVILLLGLSRWVNKGVAIIVEHISRLKLLILKTLMNNRLEEENEFIV